MVTMLLMGDNSDRQRLSYAKTLAQLEGIKDAAIVLGTGEQEVYVFVDPLCPHSRKFISMVTGNKRMLRKYRYFVYLYSIPRLNSQAAVNAIYRANDPVARLMDVMLADETISSRHEDASSTPVQRIEAVAEQINVYKRPYLFLVK